MQSIVSESKENEKSKNHIQIFIVLHFETHKHRVEPFTSKHLTKSTVAIFLKLKIRMRLKYRNFIRNYKIFATKKGFCI